MTPKFILVSAAIVIPAALAFALLYSPHESPPTSERLTDAGGPHSVSVARQLARQERPAASSKPSAQASARDIEALLARVRDMQREIDAFKRQEPASPSNESPESTLSIEEQQAQERERTMQTTTFLQNNFVAETKDATWSLQAEQQVAETLDNDAIAAGSELQNLSCQTTLCRIQLHHKDASAERVFLTRLGRLDAFSDAEAFSERMEQADGSIEVITYVSRSGHPLPRMD